MTDQHDPATDATEGSAPDAGLYGLLATMVTVLAGAAWPALGLVPNPATGKTERRLDEARLAIDLCDFITARLEGHLPGETLAALQQIVATLKLNFVEQQKRAADERGTIDT